MPIKDHVSISLLYNRCFNINFDSLRPLPGIIEVCQSRLDLILKKFERFICWCPDETNSDDASNALPLTKNSSMALMNTVLHNIYKRKVLCPNTHHNYHLDVYIGWFYIFLPMLTTYKTAVILQMILAKAYSWIKYLILIANFMEFLRARLMMRVLCLCIMSGQTADNSLAGPMLDTCFTRPPLYGMGTLLSAW